MASVHMRKRNQFPPNANSNPGPFAFRQSIEPVGSYGGIDSNATVTSPAPGPREVERPVISTARHDIENGMHYNHPKNVHQWVVSSANGSTQATGGVYLGLPLTSPVVDNGFELAGNSHGPAFNDEYESYVSMLGYTGHPQSSLSQAIPQGFCEILATSSPVAAIRTPCLEPTFVAGGQCTGDPNSGTWAAVESLYTGPPFATDVTYAASVEPAQEFCLDFWETSPSRNAWPQAQPCSEEPSQYCPVLQTGDRSWSSHSAITLDPSVSSSYSQSSHLLHYDGSPTANTNHEDPNPIAGHGCNVSLRNLDTASHFLYPHTTLESSMDVMSTIRPVPAHRQPLPSSTFSSQQDIGFYHSVMASSYNKVVMRRSSSGDGENKNTARCSVLYQAKAQLDGLYHCPFEGKENCNHPPDKLKCNYDKHLDSHLKPYKCKALACDKVPFSSTACLLRHEREAHGMHGHGEKPYLCRYEDCDRSIDGNGFPRRWNLQDHMKRVHNDVGPCSTGSASPSDSSANSPWPAEASATSRKKRASDIPQSAPMKRNKSSTAASKIIPKTSKDQSTTPMSGGQSQPMRKHWRTSHTILRGSFEGLNSPDSLRCSQIGAEDAMLNDTGMKFPFFDTDLLDTGY